MQQNVQQALSLAAATDGTIKLDLSFNGEITKRGDTISRDKAKSPPKLKLTGEASGTYIAIAIDLDAPYVSAPFLGPILHWIQPGLQPNNRGDLEYDAPCMADWVAPAPPPFSGPHRYVFALFQQPPEMDVLKFLKPGSLAGRVRWSLDDFVRQAGLDKMVAANYFCSR